MPYLERIRRLEQKILFVILPFIAILAKSVLYMLSEGPIRQLFKFVCLDSTYLIDTLHDIFFHFAKKIFCPS